MIPGLAPDVYGRMVLTIWQLNSATVGPKSYITIMIIPPITILMWALSKHTSIIDSVVPLQRA